LQVVVQARHDKPTKQQKLSCLQRGNFLEKHQAKKYFIKNSAYQIQARLIHPAAQDENSKKGATQNAF